MPPYVAAALLMSATAWYGDRIRLRGPIILLNCVITLIGLPIVGFATNPWVRYFGVFVAVAGSQSNVPTIMTYQVFFFHLDHREPNLTRIRAGKQHPRSMESSLLLGDFDWTGWHGRDIWLVDLQNPRRTTVHSRRDCNYCVSDLSWNIRIP